MSHPIRIRTDIESAKDFLKEMEAQGFYPQEMSGTKPITQEFYFVRDGGGSCETRVLFTRHEAFIEVRPA